MKKQINNSRNKQKGVSLINFLGGVSLVVFFSVVAITLVPPYLENFSVRSCLTSLARDDAILKKNESSIKAALLQKFSVSNVNSVTSNDISVKKNREGVKIMVAYHVQAKFIKNVDFIVHFDEMKEVSL